MMLLMETQSHTAPRQAGVALRQQRLLQQMEDMQRAGSQPDPPVQLPAEEDGQQQDDDPAEQEKRVLSPLQPVLELHPVDVQEEQHASAHVIWHTANYTLPEHDSDEEQVAYQLQVHYRVSYTLQLQQVSVGPPTAAESVQQLLDCVPSAVVDSAWKDVLTLDEAPTQPQRVGSLRAGRFYAVRLRARATAELDSGSVAFSDTFTSDVTAFRTVPCTPGQMQAPSLARRDRTLLKLKWNLPDETGGEVITLYQLKVKPLPPCFTGTPEPDSEGFVLVYEGLGEGPETAKDRMHFTLKPLGPGQKYSFRIRCSNPLGAGSWSLPSTFTTAPSVPSQPDPPRLVQCTADSVTLSWVPPCDNGSAITFYKLEMDDGRGGDFQHVYGGQAELQSAVITGLQSGLHYRVRLRAENGEGRSVWSAVAPISTAASLPSCPVSLKLGVTTRTAVSLSWSPPADDGGSPVQAFEVQLQAVSKVAVGDLGSDWLTIYQGPALSTNWSALRPGCRYQLRVASRNAVGCSQFSSAVFFNTNPDAPLPPPKPSALIDTRGLFINLQPPAHDGGSAITGFSIVMRCNPLAAAAAAAAACPTEHPPLMSSNWVEVWRGEYKGAPVPVLHLLPGTLYEFRAAAFNDFGPSHHSEVAAATTLSAEPLPPQAPVVVSAAGSSLTVSWTEPYGQGSPVTKYKLAYACLGPAGGSGSAAANGPVSRSSSSAGPAPANGHAELGHAAESGDDTGSVSSSGGPGSSTGPAVDKLRWEQAYTGPDLSAAVKQLQPAHRYLLRVRAVNEIGASPWSQPVSGTTAPAAPCQPVRLSAAAESSGSIAVSWQPPEVDNGAPVTAYHLEMQQAAGGAGASWTSVWQGSKLQHTVGGLQPGRKYSFRTRAVNCCGAGPWAAPVTSSTAPAVPDAPSKPVTSKVTATSAKVKWSIPLEDHGAAVKLYHVQLRQLQAGPSAAGAAEAASGSSSDGESGSCSDWQEVYAGPALDTTVSKLQPGSSYEVRVAAANAVGLGRWSAAVELATPLRAPPPPVELAAEPDAAQLGSVAVSWQQVVPGLDSAAAVSVYLEAAAGSSKEAAAKATVPVAEGSQAVLKGLRPGGTYHIRARSVGAGSTGHSAWCEPVTVVLPAPLVPAEQEQALALVDTAKRPGKAKGGKGAAAKAAAGKGADSADTDVQQRKGGRGKKGVVVEVPAKSRPAKKKPLLKVLQLKAKKYRWEISWAIVLVVVVALLFLWYRNRADANAEVVA